MNDFHKKPRKGFHKSVLDKFNQKNYQSDKKISVNKNEEELEEIDEEENRKE